MRFHSATITSPRHGRPNRNGRTTATRTSTPATSQVVDDLTWSNSQRLASNAAASSTNIGTFGRFTSQTTQCGTSWNDQEHRSDDTTGSCVAESTSQTRRTTAMTPILFMSIVHFLESMNGMSSVNVSCVASAAKEEPRTCQADSARTPSRWQSMTWLSQAQEACATTARA